MKRFTYVVLLYLWIHFIIIESIKIHKINKGSTKPNEKSLHIPTKILDEDNEGEIIYFNPTENIDNNKIELEKKQADRELNHSNEKEFNDNYLEEDLIDETDFNKIHTLNSKELLQDLRKIYYENNSENQKLIKHIKSILSKALHIPAKEINLNDVNVLINKWKIMNNNKKNKNKNNLNLDNKYHKEIQTHIPKTTDTLDWEFTYGYDNDKTETTNNTISLQYFLDLIN